METFSVLLAICEFVNPQVKGRFPSQRVINMGHWSFYMMLSNTSYWTNGHEAHEAPFNTDTLDAWKDENTH